MDTIFIATDAGVAHVRLARPEVRNAFNAAVIRELHEAFTRLHGDSSVRAIIISGDGKSFCGGADINWMRGALELGYEENVADAQAMSDMFRSIDRCAKPVIGRIHGAALGGGAGLAAVCDIAIASDETIFGFTEVKLGIIPAVISPFVLAKIGVSHARALFLTGERFSAARARQIGLVHEVVSFDELDAAVDRIVAELRTAGPAATAAAKELIAGVSQSSYEDSRDVTASLIAKRRVSGEGQEGLRAFLERRSATFAG
ncbi:MAG: enoyl-CoA hydratase-related protein [Candidatus Eremiobacteraeota bacterium]|nr:enoyl-CoA hydratase-related protein [Candidatus Eremiobacteraeota bacterium]